MINIWSVKYLPKGSPTGDGFSLGLVFKVTGNFSQGAYCGNKVNGFQAMVMQNDLDMQKIISDFENAAAAGYALSEVQEMIFEKYGITRPADRDSILRKVEEIYKSSGRMF